MNLCVFFLMLDTSSCVVYQWCNAGSPYFKKYFEQRRFVIIKWNDFLTLRLWDLVIPLCQCFTFWTLWLEVGLNLFSSLPSNLSKPATTPICRAGHMLAHFVACAFVYPESCGLVTLGASYRSYRMILLCRVLRESVSSSCFCSS